MVNLDYMRITKFPAAPAYGFTVELHFGKEIVKVGLSIESWMALIEQLNIPLYVTKAVDAKLKNWKRTYPPQASIDALYKAKLMIVEE